jgi:hypothetical protein
MNEYLKKKERKHIKNANELKRREEKVYFLLLFSSFEISLVLIINNNAMRNKR